MKSPMLATLVEEAFDSPEWLFEIKWDGYRALGCKAKKVALLSRNNQSFNDKFPTLVQELEKIPGTFVLDGEIVILDKQGRSHFQLLQNYQKTKSGTPYYYLFDILSYNDKDLTELPLLQRKTLLKKLLSRTKLQYLRFSDHILAKGKALFKKAKSKGLEGIIAKRIESTYQSRRNRDWLKIKVRPRQEVVIGGFTAPRGSRQKFGALLVGVYEKGKLLYIGKVGGGFDEKTLREVDRQLRPLVQKKCPFETAPHPNSRATWVKPKLVCEVSFSEWTREGILRQPIFEGMRADKPAKKVIRERARLKTV